MALVADIVFVILFPVAVITLVAIADHRARRWPPSAQEWIDPHAFTGEQIGQLNQGDVRSVEAAVARLRFARAGVRRTRWHARRHRAGTRQHLLPSMRPALTTYGPAAAALAVGLYGMPILTPTDPALAATATNDSNPDRSVGGGDLDPRPVVDSSGCGGGCGGCGGCGG